MDFTGIDLPQSVLDLVEFAPVDEIVLNILREGLPEVPIYTLIPLEAGPFFIIVRRKPALGDWDGDERFTDEARIELHVFTQDPNGEDKAALLAEAARVVLRNASHDKKVIPGLGSVIRIEQIQDPARRTDWATSTGPVQYADLPTEYWRYESQYNVLVRKPRS